MKRGGKHYAVSGETTRIDIINTKRESSGDTVEFKPPVKHRRISYFLFTLLVCALLAGMAAAVLAVDYWGREISDGTETAFAFGISEEGKARLSFLGRNYDADISFLAPAADFFARAGEVIGSQVPESLRFLMGSVPKIYDAVTDAVSAAVKWIRDLVTGEDEDTSGTVFTAWAPSSTNRPCTAELTGIAPPAGVPNSEGR